MLKGKLVDWLNIVIVIITFFSLFSCTNKEPLNNEKIENNDTGNNTDAESLDTNDSENTNNHTSDTSDTENLDNSAETSIDSLVPDDKPDIPSESLESIMQSYEGKTVNILATGVAINSEPVAPWSQVELCVSDWRYNSAWESNAGGFGKTINDAVLEREKYIETTYGVDVNWIFCGGTSMKNLIYASSKNDGSYHIAMPRAYEAQSLIIDNELYTIGNEYVNFDADYYCQEAIDAFTLAGNTFYVSGDISFLEEQSTYVIYYNKAAAKELGDAFSNVYQMAHNGTWTIDVLYTLAEQVSENLDGKDECTDKDKYGFATNRLDSFYQHFGTYQVGKDIVGSVQQEEMFVLTIDNDNIDTIIDKILYFTNVQNESSFRENWTDGYSGMLKAFEEERLLFYHDTLNRIFTFETDDQIGILPFPKLTTEQDRYYFPVTTWATFACVPLSTDDRILSECMIEILSKTGAEYITPAYIESAKEHFSKELLEENAKTITELIFPNMMYDIGYMYGKFNGDTSGFVTQSIQKESYVEGRNLFHTIMEYGSARSKAEDTLYYWSLDYHNYEE